MDERGTPINRAPSVGGRDLNLYKLYRIVVKMGGYNRVTNKNSWRAVYSKLGLPPTNSQPGKDSSAVLQLKAAYKKYLHSFDDFYRKLGCTITVNSRTSRPSRAERIREDRSVKKTVKKEKETKKEETVKEEKDKEKDIKDSANSSAGNSSAKHKDKDKDKEKEKVKEVKEEVKVEDIKPIVKEEVVVKNEETPNEERKRGRGRKKREEIVDEPPVDEDTMTGQSTIDESDEEDHRNYKSLSKFFLLFIYFLIKFYFIY
jgi:Ras-related protein Rab-1A